MESEYLRKHRFKVYNFLGCTLEKITENFDCQPVPFFIFKRLGGYHYREYFTYTLPNGYGYLLRRFVYQCPEIRAPQNLITPPKFEFFLTSLYQSRQVEPIPGQLFSSPGNHGIVNAAPNPVDNDLLGFVLDAPCKKYEKILNWFYPWNDTIRIDYTGPTSTDFEVTIPFADICLQGYLVPEGLTKIWRK